MLTCEVGAVLTCVDAPLGMKHRSPAYDDDFILIILIIPFPPFPPTHKA